ncbi:hypothetical protein JOD01_001010 [Brevibacillus fulvus]|uniref:Uncharacterized protein n=1 Tax=Brevibacillus fulvus TaxID=1125967 RepID=A0A939BRB0_9BACL|nr:hypothetical protein [Brevibacillus fulvus]
MIWHVDVLLQENPQKLVTLAPTPCAQLVVLGVLTYKKYASW